MTDHRPTGMIRRRAASLIRSGTAAALTVAALWLAACGVTKSVSPDATGTAGPGDTAASTTSAPAPTVSTWGTVVATEAEVAAQTAALDAAEALWRSAGAPSYTFSITNHCFCAPPFVGPIDVVVADGAVRSMTVGPETYDTAWVGSTVPTADASWLPGTAEALFDLVRQKIGQKDFEATYDAVTGFPLHCYSDPIPAAADDEYGFTTSDYRPTGGG